MPVPRRADEGKGAPPDCNPRRGLLPFAAMAQDDAETVQLAVAALVARLTNEPRLAAEVQRARREFFGNGQGLASVGRIGDSAEQRFGEWFALERESEMLGAVPFELPAYASAELQVDGTTAGVFVVVIAADGEFEARDLQGDAIFELAVPMASLLVGDLLVGRLFQLENGLWAPSTAAAVFRPGRDLGEAFRRDIERLALGRRLRQVELEHLLLRRQDQGPSPTAPAAAPEPKRGALPGIPLEHLEADLDRLLDGTGGRHQATAISERLAAASRPGQVMGPLLEELAFETSVDLDRARELLLEIWTAHHIDDAPAVAAPSQAPGEALGERLVRTLEEGLQKQHDVEELFAQLESLAGLEPGAADDEENPFDRDASGAEELAAGDLDGLVHEYLWETRRDGEAVAGPLRLWVQLQANAALPHGDLETVTGQDLMRLLLHVYLSAGPMQRADAVRATFGELEAFYEWARREQELEVGAALHECKGALLDQLDRLAAAGAQLSTEGSAQLPRFLVVEDLGGDGFGVRDDEGGHHWLVANRAAVGDLRAGDLVLGALEPRGRGMALVGMVVVLPSDARALME